MNSARVMLWVSALPQRLWGDAVLYTSYIRIYLPTRANTDHASPIEALKRNVPDVSHILRFGAKCTIHVAHSAKKSVKKRAEIGVVISVDSNKKAYHAFIPRNKRIISTTHIPNIDRLDTRAMGRYMDAVVDQHMESTSQPHNGPHIHTEEQVDSDGDYRPAPGAPSEQHDLSSRAIQRVFGLNRNARALSAEDFHLLLSFIREFANLVTAFFTIGPEGGTAFATPREGDCVKKPTSVEEAMKSLHWHEWEQAMKEELRAILENDTWEVVDISKAGTLISRKWVFKVTFDSRRELERFKARIVAHGFSQKFGIDFIETFAPVLKITSLRLIVVLATLWRAVVRQTPTFVLN
ncbi:Integrase, catalytic core protein [Phytophthora megakarya]|uniref:Integrase, catalytic core protein n=1 Tax=Phytophthora megakarya TaxID=4795 RepID=A0A225VBL4_9STRA|nr:Integrase, catalytic core protein [Phytophthora megakarya]